MQVGGAQHSPVPTKCCTTSVSHTQTDGQRERDALAQVGSKMKLLRWALQMYPLFESGVSKLAGHATIGYQWRGRNQTFFSGKSV